MRAANHKGAGRRRLLTLLAAVLAIAATLSFGLMRATAGTLQTTTTSIGITDATSGNPVGGTIPSTELVTLTATVTGTSSAPTGTIGFQTTTDGVSYTPLCDSAGNCGWNVSPTGALTSQASVTTYLPGGTYDIQATFKGANGSINSSSPKPGTPITVTTVTVHNTTTTVAANPNSITTGDSTTITATVAADDGSGMIPSGTVEFYATNGNTKTFITGATLDAAGVASFTSSAWAAQAYTIEADYLGRTFVDTGGDTVQFQTSSGTAALNVGAKINPQVATTTTVTATPNPIRSDQSVHVVATIAQTGSSTIGGATLDSNVTFTAVSATGSAVLGTAALVSNGDGTGTAVLDKGGWIPGTYTITAQYFGNVYFLGSSGSTSTIVVNQARPTTTAYIHDTQTYVGDGATLSAQVLDTQSQQPVPAGELVPLTASDAAGTGCIGTTDSNGIASCTATFPTPGTYTVTASYPGDSTFDPSTGFGQITVLQVPTSVAVTASANPAPTGSSVTLTGQLTDSRTGTPVAGKSLTLQLNNTETCTAGPTNAIGNASCAVTVSEGTGSYPTSASFAGDGPTGRYLPSNGNGSLNVVDVLPTGWTYTGTTSVYAGRPATISFVLKDSLGRVMAHRNVTLSFDGTDYSATTDATGVATQTVTAPATPGSYTPTASYSGEPGFLSSTGSGTLQVNTVPTSLTYTGDTNVDGGSTANLKFVLEDQGGNTLANMPVTLTFQGTDYNVTTDANGVASATAAAPLSAGSYPVTASFGGRLPYVASTGLGSVTVTTIPTTVTYVGDTSVYQGSTATLAAKLLTSSGAPLANESVTLTLATGETCSGITNASGIASCQVVVNEATTLTGSPYDVAISFGGDLPYLASSGHGALAVVAQYPADSGVIGSAKAESLIADPTVVSPTQLTVVATDDQPIIVSGAQQPTAVLNTGQQLYVTTSPSSGQPLDYVDTNGGSTSNKYQALVSIKLPAGLAPGQYSVTVTAFDGDGDYDQWTWTLQVDSNGNVGTVNPGPGPLTCGGKIKCESILADPSVVSSSQLSIVAMDDSIIPTTGSSAPSATLDGQALPITTSTTSGKPQNYVDNYGGSMSGKYQTLITINLPGHLAAGDHSILVTSYDGDGDLDQWSWPITIGSHGAVTSNYTAGGGASSSSATSSITGATTDAVDAGNTLWLTNSAKVTGLPPTGATITLTNQTVTVGGTTISLPDAEIYYSPYATTATTVWDPVNNEWDTTVPKAVPGNVFASGFGYVPSAPIGKKTPVTWSATVSSDTPGVSVAWQWAAAEYTSFNSDPSQLGVKPCDDPKASGYAGKDKAGTPENYKSFLTAGGTGGGGGNYTGANSPNATIKF